MLAFVGEELLPKSLDAVVAANKFIMELNYDNSEQRNETIN